MEDFSAISPSGGKTNATIQKKPLSRVKKKDVENLNGTYLKIGAVFLVVAGIASTLAATLTGPSDPCQIVRSSYEDGWERMTCPEVDCEFDISLCSSPCPFGYEKDSNRCPVSCLCAGDTKTFEGDIHISENELPKFMQAYGYHKENEDFSLLVGSAIKQTDTKTVKNFLWDDEVENGKYVIYFTADDNATWSARRVGPQEIS
ncbi:unnamed protein product [Clavelina lepadiformis]|uniref:Uncharacterized protein n=1 Tax=Clavelina lepadiformis TaxID=159417 RepID=A0ABP0FIY5_CLALP